MSLITSLTTIRHAPFAMIRHTTQDKTCSVKRDATWDTPCSVILRETQDKTWNVTWTLRNWILLFKVLHLMYSANQIFRINLADTICIFTVSYKYLLPENSIVPSAQLLEYSELNTEMFIAECELSVPLLIYLVIDS